MVKVPKNKRRQPIYQFFVHPPLSARVRDGKRADDNAWVAKAPRQPLGFEAVDLGPFGPEDVEGAVEHCGLCHSDLSVLNNDWGNSQDPANLGHEVERVAAG
jgi:hypothetical protein